MFSSTVAHARGRRNYNVERHREFFRFDFLACGGRGLFTECCNIQRSLDAVWHFLLAALQNLKFTMLMLNAEFLTSFCKIKMSKNLFEGLLFLVNRGLNAAMMQTTNCSKYVGPKASDKRDRISNSIVGYVSRLGLPGCSRQPSVQAATLADDDVQASSGFHGSSPDDVARLSPAVPAYRYTLNKQSLFWATRPIRRSQSLFHPQPWHQPTRPDDGCGASVSRDGPVCGPAFAGTHCAYPRRDGQTELTWVDGYISGWFTHLPAAITHPGTNQDRCRITSLMRPKQTALDKNHALFPALADPERGEIGPRRPPPFQSYTVTNATIFLIEAAVDMIQVFKNTINLCWSTSLPLPFFDCPTALLLDPAAV